MVETLQARVAQLESIVTHRSEENRGLQRDLESARASEASAVRESTMKSTNHDWQMSNLQTTLSQQTAEARALAEELREEKARASANTIALDRCQAELSHATRQLRYTKQSHTDMNKICTRPSHTHAHSVSVSLSLSLLHTHKFSHSQRTVETEYLQTEVQALRATTTKGMTDKDDALRDMMQVYALPQ